MNYIESNNMRPLKIFLVLAFLALPTVSCFADETKPDDTTAVSLDSAIEIIGDSLTVAAIAENDDTDFTYPMSPERVAGTQRETGFIFEV
jgi:hypothetical protein